MKSRARGDGSLDESGVSPIGEPRLGGAAPVSVAGAVAQPLPPRLSAQQMSKRFGSLVALDAVSFELEPGTVHALLGENGAGKSTLVKCIMGFHKADSGRVVIGDSQVSIENPRQARELGIGMVYQHFTLVENMSVAENLVLPRLRRARIIDWNAEIAAIEAFMASAPFRLPPRKLVRQLAAGEKQKLEILAQLYLGSRIIILDEPTSVLTPAEADSMLGTLRGMVEAKALSAIIITHKFREVTAFADDVTVLRRGRVAGSGRAQDLSPRELATLMVGGDVPVASVSRASSPVRSSDPVLEIEALHAEDDIGLPVLRGFGVRVHAGEIVGIAGVSGNGQDELVEVLAGQRTPSSGRVLVGGGAYLPTREHIRRAKLRLLPEAPLKNACVAPMSVSENMAFRSYDEPPIQRWRWFIDKARMRERAQRAIAEFRVKTPSPEAPIGQLSGGNVQRSVLARELSEPARVLVAANPCFGLDIAAVAEIYARLGAARDAGTAILLVSADLDEIFSLADRIVVISEGRVVFESQAAEADRSVIGYHMGGAAEPARQRPPSSARLATRAS